MEGDRADEQAIAEASQPSRNRVNKANQDTIAARWNRGQLHFLTAALRKDPEANMVDLLSSSYSKKLKSYKSVLPSGSIKRRITRPSLPRSDVRSKLDETAPTKLLCKPTADVQELLGNPSEDDLTAALVNLVATSMGFIGHGVSISDDMVVKVAAKSHSATTEHHSLEYLRKHLPHFPAPRPHGLIRLGNYDFLFTSRISGRDLEQLWPELDHPQKKTISTQIDDLLLQLRSLPRPPNMPLGDVRRGGCSDSRRFLRRSSEPIMDAEQFEEFIAAGYYKASSGPYARLLRRLMSNLSSATKCVFTHGDLRPANIMVDTGKDGDWHVSGIVDWESSGFYPEYWESVKMTNNLSLADKWDWYDYMPASVSQQRYPIEWLVDRLRGPSMSNS
ncbi:kinase-like domain-containing protein [Xylariaceae sp. FL0255]|nr:kinase-like domain-containing protein [Xylariaceae sp. FL0255]